MFAENNKYPLHLRIPHVKTGCKMNDVQLQIKMDAKLKNSQSFYQVFEEV